MKPVLRKSLIFSVLIFLQFHSFAQVKSNGYLYGLYQTQGGTALFKTITDLRKAKKAAIEKRISALSESTKNEIKKNADIALHAPWAVLSFSLFNEYKINGNRINYENHYFSRRNKLAALVIGELVANDGRYLPEIADGIGLLSEESTWALPAHMGLQKAGDGLPDANEPIIDLFVGQTAVLLSWTKWLLSEQLDKYSPQLNKRIEAELKSRVFEPYLKRNDFWWMGFETNRKMNNWNIFINTNVLSAALFADEDPNIQSLIIDKSLRSVDYFLKGYPADGGCDEGPSYWGIAGGALIEYIDLLTFFSGQKLDFSKSELIHQIGTYIMKVHVDKNYFVNFADAAAANGQDATKIYKFGRLFNDQQLLEFAAYVRHTNGGEERFDIGNIQSFVGALEIREGFKGIKPLAPQPKSSWLKDLQVLTARQKEGSANGLFFAAKGGHNGESHNHNDIGNFILYKDGTPMVIDAGVGTYTKQTFSANRYQLWYMQSAWHNCPTINGAMQKSGANFKAKAIKYTADGAIVKLSMDVAPAYAEDAAVISWNRNFIFNQEKGTLTLSENYELQSFKEPSVVNFLIYGTVAPVGKGLLQLSNAEGKIIFMQFNPAAFDYTIEIKKIDDARLATSWHNDLSRIILKRKGKKLTGNYVIVFKN